MDRVEALDILKQYVKSDQLLRHSYAVEAAMKSYAIKFEENAEEWGNLGLLHDIDFELYPDIHPGKAPELLKKHNIDKEFIEDVLSHGLEGEALRTNLKRHCLHAVDEMASFIIAIALMRPEKFDGLKAKSVKKKMKSSGFAKAVNREELTASIEPLNIEFAEHVDIIVDGLIKQENKLNEEGFSLLG